MKKLLFLLASALIFSACTISVVTSHNQNGSTDTVDTDQEADPNISPNLNIPVSPLVK